MNQYPTSAIVVLFNPDMDLLRRNLDSISPQVDHVYVVDNTPDSDLSESFSSRPSTTYIPLRENRGIAAAQNVGVKAAADDGARFIYFNDQDSISPDGIVSQLLKTFSSLSGQGIKVGAVGPRPFNRAENMEYHGPGERAFNGKLTEVGELISSGSLIPVEVLADVGVMDESLFIDGVDHEWCWRAGAAGGYRFFIDENCRLSHSLGQGDRRMLTRKVAIPAPARTYYLYRNYFLLSRRGYVPFRWKLVNGVKLACKVMYYPLFITPRIKYAANIFRGMADGIAGKTGALSK